MYWLLYRKGSFLIRERFATQRAATHRLDVIDRRVSFVQIVDAARVPARLQDPIANALELDPTTNRLVFTKANCSSAHPLSM
jgi:hypothetical protein